MEIDHPVFIAATQLGDLEAHRVMRHQQMNIE